MVELDTTGLSSYGTGAQQPQKRAGSDWRQAKKSGTLIIEAQERFEQDDFKEVAPNAIAQALFEIRLSLWLCFAVLCLLLWRLW
ncbi:hypothetical protein [Mesorhizobium sp.]|uniref:hypothetical protein n=1 Tax=Mesorhizobium sp. TaxID=1871066 RepID=UPI000FE89ED0|nr:hypothetical protein [Mesorhizobium sp.]RWI86944.1 MAG: hypothetical protein EOR21_28775 [Mesorhizobium sp.]